MSKLPSDQRLQVSLAEQSHQSVGAQTTSAASSGLTADFAVGLPRKPSSALKKEGWSGFMREVADQGGVVVMRHNQPEAVVLSVDRYDKLIALAQGEQIRGTQKLVDLSARFDRRLASLNTAQSRQALDAFMDEPLVLNGQVRAGAVY